MTIGARTALTETGKHEGEGGHDATTHSQLHQDEV